MRVLPEGYRIEFRYFWRPVLVAGHLRYCCWIPMVQRLTSLKVTEDEELGEREWLHDWHDVGFLDDLLPGLGKPGPIDVEGF